MIGVPKSATPLAYHNRFAILQMDAEGPSIPNPAPPLKFYNRFAILPLDEEGPSATDHSDDESVSAVSEITAVATVQVSNMIDPTSEGASKIMHKYQEIRRIVAALRAPASEATRFEARLAVLAFQATPYWTPESIYNWDKDTWWAFI